MFPPVIIDRVSGANARAATVSANDPVQHPLQNGLFNGLIWPKVSFASSA
jgi:hypothetical protein